MKRFIICMLSDESITAGYEICNDLKTAKEMVFSHLPDVDHLILDNDGYSRISIQTKKDGDAYKFFVRYDTDRFFIYQILPVQIHNNEYVCVSHNDGCDATFSIKTVGSYSDCFDEISEKLKVDLNIEIRESSDYRLVSIDVHGNTEVIDIVQYSFQPSGYGVIYRNPDDEEKIIYEDGDISEAWDSLKNNFWEILQDLNLEDLRYTTLYGLYSYLAGHSCLLCEKTHSAWIIQDGLHYEWYIEEV